MSRPYSGCYESLRTHAADEAAMRGWVNGDYETDGPIPCPYCQDSGRVLAEPAEPWRSSYWTDCECTRN
jgi:hypothetical protein